MHQGKRARKKYLVQSGLQFRYGVTIFMATLVVSVLAVWTTYLTTWTEISRQIDDARLYAHFERIQGSTESREQNIEMMNAVVAAEFSDVFDRVSMILLVRLFIGSLFLFVLSIFVSHKIAGPAWRIERAAQALQKGDLSVNLSNLRLGDELDGLARSLHRGVQRIRSLVDDCKYHAARVEQSAKETAAESARVAGVSPEIKKSAKNTELLAGQLVVATDRLKTASRSVKSSTE